MAVNPICDTSFADSRVLIRKGRKRAQKYFRTYKDPISTQQLVLEVAAIMQEFTQSGYNATQVE
jgi:20S proteasome alpha/beta subunit